MDDLNDALDVGAWLILLPFLLAILCGAVALARRDKPALNRFLAHLTVLVSLVLLGYSIWLMTEFDWNPAGAGHDIKKIALFALGGYQVSLDLHVDALSVWFILLANIIAFAAALNVAGDANAGDSRSVLRHPAFFLASLNGFYFAMLLVPILNNLVGLWIGIELTTLASALVIGFRNTPAAWEAAWKYLIITSAGIVLALLGTVFLAHAVPLDIPLEILEEVGIETRDAQMNWTSLMQLARGEIPGFSIDQRFVVLSFMFALIGYGTKAGLTPMHTWLPDGHGEAPPAISALLSGVLIKLAFYAILRFYTITNAALQDTTLSSALLLGAGVLSLVIATPFILKRNRFKRVLAYHSVEHMGIICAGIGIGTKLALAGALLHTLNHAVTKSLMFLAYGNVDRQYTAALKRPVADIELKGIVRAMPKTAAFLALAGLALIGTPPFSIFFSELMILWGALQRFFAGSTEAASIAGLPDWAVVLGVALFMLTTTLIFFGLVRHLSEHLLGTAPPGVTKKSVTEHWLYDLGPLFVLTLGILPLLLFLPVVMTLVEHCVEILALPKIAVQP